MPDRPFPDDGPKAANALPARPTPDEVILAALPDPTERPRDLGRARALVDRLWLLKTLRRVWMAG
ncbi:MAG TPA: hypothetical protein VNF73_03130 [Candidatus Saccharimonadales bacterium]|nr:hypothetical protein [Candidatus Saccharimonadales bacterium]